jgi:hypothetical protein
MSDASVFRQYAEEAMREASNAKNGDERKALEKLACIWAQAALMSGQGVGPNFISALRAVAEATPYRTARQVKISPHQARHKDRCQEIRPFPRWSHRQKRHSHDNRIS